MSDLEARSHELAEKVRQLEALSAIGEAVNSNLDLAALLSTIVQHAVELSDADGGSILEYDEDDGTLSVRAQFGPVEELPELFRQVRLDMRSPLVGRAALPGEPEAVTDLAEDRHDVHMQL